MLYFMAVHLKSALSEGRISQLQPFLTLETANKDDKSFMCWVKMQHTHQTKMYSNPTLFLQATLLTNV